MAAENIIPTQSEVPSLRASLWQHYWQHLWLGAAIWVGIGLFFMAYELISSLPIGNEHIPEVGSLIEVGFGIGFVFLFWSTLTQAACTNLAKPPCP